MKIIVILIIGYLFLSRIIETKKDINGEMYEKTYSAECSKYKNDKLLKMLGYQSIILGLTYGYILIQNYNFLINMLSIIQILTLFVTINHQVSDILNQNYIYHKIHMIFNLILDYLYYPIVLFLLITH